MIRFRAYVTITYSSGGIKSLLGTEMKTKEEACEEVYAYLLNVFENNSFLYNIIREVVLELQKQEQGTVVSRQVKMSDFVTIRTIIVKGVS